MKTWIVPSESAELDTIESVHELLEPFHGPLSFHMKEEPCTIMNPLRVTRGREKKRRTTLDYDPGEFNTMRSMIAESSIEVIKVFDWDEIFKACNVYRLRHNIPAEDFLILGTGHDNVPAWFSCFNPNGSRNAFVHLDDWDQYINANKKFPVAYSIAEVVLQQMLYARTGNFFEKIHREPVGCINDLCESKKDVRLKLRTADICSECLNLMAGAQIPPLYIDQALRIFNGIREQMMFSEGFRKNVPPGRLHIDDKGRITLPDFGNMRINIPTQETSLYLLFLEHPEGIVLNDLHHYIERLFKIYSSISGIADFGKMRDSIVLLVNQNNKINEKISRIKKAFEDRMGKENAGPYIITGNPTEAYGIKLDRVLMKNEMSV